MFAIKAADFNRILWIRSASPPPKTDLLAMQTLAMRHNWLVVVVYLGPLRFIYRESSWGASLSQCQDFHPKAVRQKATPALPLHHQSITDNQKRHQRDMGQ